MSLWSVKMDSGSMPTGWSSLPLVRSSKTCCSRLTNLTRPSSWGLSLTPPWQLWWASSTSGRQRWGKKNWTAFWAWQVSLAPWREGDDQYCTKFHPGMNAVPWVLLNAFYKALCLFLPYQELWWKYCILLGSWQELPVCDRNRHHCISSLRCALLKDSPGVARIVSYFPKVILYILFSRSRQYT